MQTFTASVDLDPEQVAALVAAARFYGLPVPAFLNACLESGIAHAQALSATADMDGDAESPDPSDAA